METNDIKRLEKHLASIVRVARPACDAIEAITMDYVTKADKLIARAGLTRKVQALRKTNILHHALADPKFTTIEGFHPADETDASLEANRSFHLSPSIASERKDLMDQCRLDIAPYVITINPAREEFDNAYRQLTDLVEVQRVHEGPDRDAFMLFTVNLAMDGIVARVDYEGRSELDGWHQDIDLFDEGYDSLLSAVNTLSKDSPVDVYVAHHDSARLLMADIVKSAAVKVRSTRPDSSGSDKIPKNCPEGTMLEKFLGRPLDDSRGVTRAYFTQHCASCKDKCFAYATADKMYR